MKFEKTETAIPEEFLAFTPLRFVGLVLALGVRSWAVDPTFVERLMGNTGGEDQGQATLVDVDLDGDLDWLMSSSMGTMFWEFKGKTASPMWVMHNIGPEGKCETSAKAFDITGDGYPDQLSGSNWLRNPGGVGKDIKGPWEEHTNNGVNVDCADAILGDWNNDLRLDVAYAQNGKSSAWYGIPPGNPASVWIPHVWPGVTTNSRLAAGDFDGNGFLDVAIANKVLLSKNKDGSEWEITALPIEDTSVVLEAGDLDGDGDMDLIVQKNWGPSDNIWVENLDGSGRNWAKHIVGMCETRGHSANIADIDNDGDMDFELGEDGGVSKWYLNEGNQTFRELVFTSKPTHDLRVGDVDGDGDLDMIAKPWSSGDHWYIENLLVDNGGPRMDRLTQMRGPMGSHNPNNPNRAFLTGCMDPTNRLYNWFAFHSGPITMGCDNGDPFGPPTTLIKRTQHSTQPVWTFSFLDGGFIQGSPAYRLDGTRLSKVAPHGPRWQIAVGKRDAARRSE